MNTASAAVRETAFPYVPPPPPVGVGREPRGLGISNALLVAISSVGGTPVSAITGCTGYLTLAQSYNVNPAAGTLVPSWSSNQIITIMKAYDGNDPSFPEVRFGADVGGVTQYFRLLVVSGVITLQICTTGTAVSPIVAAPSDGTAVLFIPGATPISDPQTCNNWVEFAPTDLTTVTTSGGMTGDQAAIQLQNFLSAQAADSSVDLNGTHFSYGGWLYKFVSSGQAGNDYIAVCLDNAAVATGQYAPSGLNVPTFQNYAWTVIGTQPYATAPPGQTGGAWQTVDAAGQTWVWYPDPNAGVTNINGYLVIDWPAAIYGGTAPTVVPDTSGSVWTQIYPDYWVWILPAGTLTETDDVLLVLAGVAAVGVLGYVLLA
jgi:hypothetical protein